MKSKKVIIIGPAFPFRGGISNFNNSLALAFQKKNITPIIFSFSLQYPSFLFPGKTQYESGQGPEGIEIRTRINSVNPFNWVSVANEINKESPDYVIIRYWLPFMAPCLGTISRLINKNIKVIAITDNIIPHEKRIGDNILTKYFVKSCDAFLALSSSVLDDLSKFTNCTEKIFLPHPIYDTFGKKVDKEKALLNLSLDPKFNYLLFFGFVRKYKGLDLLLRAFADQRIKDLDVKLIVAGEFYDDKKEYLNMISDLKISDNIILHSDFINADMVKNYFCAADMITQTYRTATQSGVTQIAYHFERPMLVTNVGGLAEIVPHNKVGYVTSLDPEDIADSICDFYLNKKEREFTCMLLEEKKRFSWDTFVDGLEDLINSN